MSESFSVLLQRLAVAAGMNLSTRLYYCLKPYISIIHTDRKPVIVAGESEPAAMFHASKIYFELSDSE